MISLGAFAPGHQHRADQQIHGRQQFHQVRLVRIKRVRRVQGDVEETHAFQIHFEDGHVRAEALRHARGVDAGGAAAEHHDFARQHARARRRATRRCRRNVSPENSRRPACYMRPAISLIGSSNGRRRFTSMVS